MQPPIPNEEKVNYLLPKNHQEKAFFLHSVGSQEGERAGLSLACYVTPTKHSNKKKSHFIIPSI